VAAGESKILWRVSSTLFSHFRNDVDLTPMAETSHLVSKEQAKQYKPMTAYEKLIEELTATSMVKPVINS
jgi:hypothetical protein